MRRILAGTLLAFVLAPSVAHAQAAWDAPPLLGPHAPGGLSIMLTAAGRGVDALGALAQWRADRASLGLAYRVGIVNSDADRVAVLGGVDVSGLLAGSIEDADVQVAWWTGIGGSVGDDLLVSVPLGLVASWRGLGDGNAFAPYAGGHVVLDLATGEGRAVRLEGALDLGLELTLATGWVVRFGGSLLGREALAVGIKVPS